MKIGRNSPCPCGSGKKFKRCHGSVPSGGDASSKAIPEAVVRWAKAVMQQREEHEAHFGKIRPAVHVSAVGKKFVVVGKRMYRLSREANFHEFLLVYIESTLGASWMKEEARKPLSERHLILQWREALITLDQRSPRTTTGEVVADAFSQAYLLLAFDLYALLHHGALQRKLVERLRRPDHFQGARHELFAAAVCIRAGLEIQYFDPRRGPRRPEFIGRHSVTGSRVAVEAKSRHRPGSFGVPAKAGSRSGDASPSAKALLAGAFEKETSDPLVVFLDVNLPVAERNPEYWMPGLAQEISEVCPGPGPDPYGLLVVHNYPLGYCAAGDEVPQRAILSQLSPRPRVPHDESLLLEIKRQAEAWGSLPPADFPTDLRPV